MLESLLQPNDDFERCGVILKDGTVVEIENIAMYRENSYEMNPVEVLEHIDNLAATWHTHPKGPSSLSGDDQQGFLLWPELEHMVISPEGVRRYRVHNGVLIECD